LMFVGEGPSKEDATLGEPFRNDAGNMLRQLIEKVGLLPEEVYLTMSVACRACEKGLDAAGNELVRVDYKTKVTGPVWRDTAPKPAQLAACRARVLEEIYLVDPVLIVTLGASATEQVLGRKFDAYNQHGQLQTLELDGSLRVPVLTPKKRLWFRRNKGEEVPYPMAPNKVRYMVLPTLPLYHVMKRVMDRGASSPLRLLHGDIVMAAKVLETYLLEVHGIDKRATPVGSIGDLEQEYHSSILAGNDD